MPKTLLLADDSVVIQKLVGLSFANENVEIVATDNGDDAIEKAREVIPDVVLADVVMPGKSGYEVCEAIKQDPKLAHVPVLLLTGTFEAFDGSRAESAGSDGQITKPFEAKALVERVTEVMNRPAPEPITQIPSENVAAVSVTASDDSSPGTSGQVAFGTPTGHPSDLEADVSVADDDFFDANMTTLSPLEAAPVSSAGRHATTDSTPAYPGDTSASLLFGTPGEGAQEDLDIEGGGLSLGQAVAGETTPAEDATIAILEDAPSLPPRAETGSLDDYDDLGLDAPFNLPPATSTADLDSALDAAPDDRDATILVAHDEINAKTSPNLEEEPEAKSASDALTVHAPSAPIDTDSAEASGPLGHSAPPADSTVVANLDTSLDATPTDSDASEAAASHRAGQGASLDLGPSSLASDDLNFGFDVSEQAPPGLYNDSPEDSFSSLMDISSSTLLGDSAPEISATPTSEPDEAPPLDGDSNSDSQDIMVGYDVSSSDLATAPPSAVVPSPSGVEISEPIPAVASSFPQPTPIPALPPQHAGDAHVDSGPADDSAEGVVSLESPPTPSDAAEVENDDIQIGDSISPSTPSSPSDSDESEGESIVAAAHELAAGVFEMPISLVDVAAEEEPREEPAESAAAETDEIAEDASLLEAEHLESRRVSDLSPLMEQRIQETLEKVAWEAFSDLSESIVKQVMGRVEQIAWEVIPQMAETLVREEIRKMKGEDD